MDHERRNREIEAISQKYMGKKHGYNFRREIRGVNLEIAMEQFSKLVNLKPQDGLGDRRSQPPQHRDKLNPWFDGI